MMMKTKQVIKYSPKNGIMTREESPNSVISQSAMLTSHPSSASGSMDHRRFSISDIEQSPSSDAFKKAEGVDDYAESDLDSARLVLVQRRFMSRNAKSAQCSPDHKPKYPKVMFQNSRAQVTSRGHMMELQGQIPKEQQFLPPNYSFSSALKECQSRKLQTGSGVDRSNPHKIYEDLPRDSGQVISAPGYGFKERRRPASMDLIAEIDPNGCYSNAVAESTIASLDQKVRDSNQRSASGRFQYFPSPGTPSRQGHGMSTSASSRSVEKASMAANAHRNGRGLGTHNMSTSVRNLPSKWDDAEKWVCAPALSDSPTNAVHKKTDYYRKPKSKSGPLVVVGSASPNRPLYYSKTKVSTAQGFHQPSTRILNTENTMVQTGSRPGSTSTLQENLQGHNTTENLRTYKLADPAVGGESYITRSASVDGWSFQARLAPDVSIPQAAQTVKELGNSIPEHCEPKSGNADTQSNLNRSQSAREILQVPIYSDLLTQDKYADTVLETPRLYPRNTISSIKEEMVVVKPKIHGSCKSSMKDASTEISPTVSRRDMATQITPLGSSRTSRCGTPKKSNSPVRHNTPAGSDSGRTSTMDVLELQLAKLDVKDDTSKPKVYTPGKRVVSSWRTREEEEEDSSKSLRYFDVGGDWKKNIVEARASAWEEAERSKFLARINREEAKITAWENHQKAKAEADMKKLEMKLEKIRSRSTEKIMNKLAYAHKKAEDMRVTLAAQQAEQLSKTMERVASIRSKSEHGSTLAGCFFM